MNAVPVTAWLKQQASLKLSISAGPVVQKSSYTVSTFSKA